MVEATSLSILTDGGRTSASARRLRCCVTLDSWIRRRLAMRPFGSSGSAGKRRFAELRKRGVGKDLAAPNRREPPRPVADSSSPALSYALPNAYFQTLGLPTLVVRPKT